MRRTAQLSTALLLVLGASTVSAQIPQSFTNLEVLDKDISRPELIGTMQSWTRALGVRCTHCHVGPDNLQGMDFATDDKAAKRTARRMVALVQQLNGPLLADLPAVAERGGSVQRVTCEHCHRGLTTPPLPTATELTASFREGGAAGAIARFGELAEQHADAGRYDLTVGPLFQLGRGLINEGKNAEAVDLLQRASELFPEEADLFVLLAQAQAGSGDLGAAKSSLGRAREIEPENRFADWLEGQIAAASESEEEPR